MYISPARFIKDLLDIVKSFGKLSVVFNTTDAVAITVALEW